MSKSNDSTLENRDAEDAKEREAEIRSKYVFFRIEVGTPWDNGAHLSMKSLIPREDFVLNGWGVLTQEFADVATQMEYHIRNVLIPEAIAREEAERHSKN